MRATPLSQIARAVDGLIVSGDAETNCIGVATDSRSVKTGELFFALKGANFDGHDYIEAAAAQGASGAVVSRPVQIKNRPGFCQIVVADPLAGLQRWAAAYRSAFNLPVVGITGSTGKTSTKDLTAQVLSGSWPVLATPGNRNNELGLPLTLLELNDHHGAAVLEMGMRGRGEIALLCSIARPSCGVITNIGRTHIERLGTVENIAAAKGELLESLKPGQLALLNRDDPYCLALGETARCRVRYFGLSDEAHVTARDLEAIPEGYRFEALLEGKKFSAVVPLWGVHNVVNSLAALAVGFYLGLDPAGMIEALSQAKLSGMRLEPVAGIGGSLLLNDAYNASPASTRAALAALVERRRGRVVAVLGDMLELGEYAASAHHAIGRDAAALGISLLIAVGPLSAQTAAGALEGGMESKNVYWFSTKEEALPFLCGNLQEGDLVLIKASRGMHLETLVASLTAKP